MKKLIGFIVTALFFLVAGFWLAETHLLEGTWAGDALTAVTRRIPVPDTWGAEKADIYNADDIASMYSVEVPDSSQTDSTEERSGSSNEIDHALVEQTIFELLNDLRTEQGLDPLVKNAQLKKAADQRARETEESFSHTRPDGSDTFTILREPEYEYSYRLAGENLGMATYHLDEEAMAEVIFNGWVESEGHYENMIKPEFEEVGIGVHYDGEFLYATQLFGTPMY